MCADANIVSLRIGDVGNRAIDDRASETVSVSWSSCGIRSALELVRLDVDCLLRGRRFIEPGKCAGSFGFGAPCCVRDAKTACEPDKPSDYRDGHQGDGGTQRVVDVTCEFVRER